MENDISFIIFDHLKRLCDQNGHNTLSGCLSANYLAHWKNLQGNCVPAVFQKIQPYTGRDMVGFSETQQAHSSLVDFSMGKIVGRKAPLTVSLYSLGDFDWGYVMFIGLAQK